MGNLRIKVNVSRVCAKPVAANFGTLNRRSRSLSLLHRASGSRNDIFEVVSSHWDLLKVARS